MSADEDSVVLMICCSSIKEGRISRFRILKSIPLRYLIREFCRHNGASDEGMTLYLRGDKINPESTAEELHDAQKNVFQLMVGSEEPKGEVSIPTVTLKLRHKAQTQSYRIYSHDRMRTLMEQYCLHNSIDRTKTQFKFDGNTLKEDHIPFQLDMDDGDLIDVIVNT
ncbi:ubiquitin family protein [Planoprotostelium fungivorum]|uniref:Ubiquitin family protein n=1 Tax=Planoprotostelium fungivorum TaxID=1890364 RepID=A0A2P6NF86_9EUKA|nr:ubiquitin family protein [Planoprotostelium fungivorum]